MIWGGHRLHVDRVIKYMLGDCSAERWIRARSGAVEALLRTARMRQRESKEYLLRKAAWPDIHSRWFRATTRACCCTRPEVEQILVCWREVKR